MYKDIIISSSVKEQFDLSDRTVLITGAAGFLGVQFAEAIAEMGGIPLLVDLDLNALEKTIKILKKKGYAGQKLFVADITDESICKNVVDEILKEFF